MRYDRTHLALAADVFARVAEGGQRSLVAAADGSLSILEEVHRGQVVQTLKLLGGPDGPRHFVVRVQEVR